MLTHAPILIIAIPLITAFGIPIIGKLSEKLRDVITLSSLMLTLAMVSKVAREVIHSGIHVYSLGAKSIGLTLPSGYEVPVRIILEVDAMGAMMAIISSVLLFAGFIYSLAFMKDRDGLTRFYSLFMLLGAGMMGMILTGDTFNLFVFLEVTSVAACGLIGFNLQRGQSQEAAFKTLALYTIGALFFLFAVGILYGQYNALNIAYLSGQISYGFLDKVALGLFVISLSMKVGAVPMHMWVPDAYAEAPSPVSLILVSNTLVSLYALYRICFSLFGLSLDSYAVGWIIVVLGTLSIFIGVTMAFLQNKIKRLLGYCALSQVGYMFLGVGVGLAVSDKPELVSLYGKTALKGGLFHILNDALYMGLLFLTAGAIIYRTGTRDMNNISGLAKSMKWTSIFALVGVGAIAGLPPFNGFASKIMIYESVFKFSPLLSIIAIIASILTLAVLMKMFYSTFLGTQLERYEELREVPKSMTVAMALLTIVIILIGLFPNVVVNQLIDPAATALLNPSQYQEAVMQLAGGS